jgi:hypothetical protein
MEIQILNMVQYKILSEVGKKVVLPLFLKNTTEIINNIFNLKKSSTDITKSIKKEIEETDLEYKIIAISSFLQEISEENYDSKTIHMHLSGIYEILENINKELNVINEECKYIETSWYHYIIGWTFFSSNINLQNIKKYINLLKDRYDMLLKILMVKN